MRILALHSDFIKFKPTKKAIKSAEDIDMDEKEMKDCLVVFSSVEKRDESNVEGTVDEFVKQVKDIIKQLKTDKIVIYPYAHLSSDLASPSIAVDVLKKAEERLKEEFKVLRAPFGWYKKFEVSCKGHPLAELSREFVAIGKKPTGEKKRKEGSEFHRFFLIDEKGNVEEIDGKKWNKAKSWNSKSERMAMLKNFVRNELSGNVPKGAPKHIEIMRKLELFDYVPYSDVGNLRAYPNGSLMIDLLSDFVLYNSALKLGAVKLQNPLMYDPENKTIWELVKDFHERDYKVVSEKKIFNLRHSSDVLNFPMFQKMNITYKQMPFAIYELAPSFRLEKRGECVGLKRLRSFTMPDIHVFTKSKEEGMEKIEELCYNFADMINNVLGDKWVLGWEIVEEYWNKYKDYFIRITKKMGCPALVKLMPEMSHYYAFKNEYQAISKDGSNVQTGTLQLDVKDGERFNIKYLDSDGKRKPCYIIHTAPIGSIERAIYLVLENSVYSIDKNKPPMIPLWLTPEQVRVIPVSDKYLDEATKVAEKLEAKQIRVGVDDRDMSLGKKVFDAKSKWIPYIVVVGEKEKESKRYSVVIRESSTLKKDDKREMDLKELVSHIKERTNGLPFRPSYVNRFLSKRLVFISWSQK